MELGRAWQEGGAVMFPLALLGLVGVISTLGLGIVAIAARRRSQTALVVSTLLLALGVLTLLVGAIGWQVGLQKTENAVAHVNPADKAMIFAEGRSEARVDLIFGGLAAMPALIGGLALFGLGLAKLPRYNPPLAERVDG